MDKVSSYIRRKNLININSLASPIRERNIKWNILFSQKSYSYFDERYF